MSRLFFELEESFRFDETNAWEANGLPLTYARQLAYCFGESKRSTVAYIYDISKLSIVSIFYHKIASLTKTARSRRVGCPYPNIVWRRTIRLSILVDLEVLQRDNGRLSRSLKKTNFHLAATLEDFDFSPSRGLDRRLVLELSQLGQNWGRENFPRVCAWT